LKLTSYLNIAIKSIMILIAGALLGACLLTLCFLLPVNQKHFEEAKALIGREAWYPMMPELSAGMYFETFSPGILDNSSDHIMLCTAMDDSEGSPLVKAMNMYSEHAGAYSYYWHGYVTILRPLSLFLNYSEIRVLNGMFQILLIVFLVHALWKKKGRAYGMVALLAYFLLMPGALSVSLQYSWVFYIAFIGTLLLVNQTEKWEKDCSYLLLFLGLGMLTSFFDLLTYPLITWGIPALMLVLVSNQKKSVFGWLRRVVASGSMWILGYGGMWYLKWVLGTWVLKRDIVQLAIDEVFLRVGVEDQVVWSSRWMAIARNWAHYEYILYMLLITGALVWICYRCIRNGWKQDNRHFAFALIAFSPFVWYSVLTNHTMDHHLFTYRIFCIGILAVICAGLTGLEESDRKGEIGSKYGRYVWGGILAAAVIMVCCSQQDKYVFNGTCAGREVLLADGETLVTEFWPGHGEINRMYFYVHTESTQGYYHVELYHEDTLLDQRWIPMERARESGFLVMDVDWFLDTESKYELQITAKDGNEDGFILAANAGEELLPEYGYRFRIGERFEDGQIISGIEYQYHKLPEGEELFHNGITGLLCGLLPVYMIADIVVMIQRRKEEKQNEVDEIQN